ncbi:YxiJ family protein [Bacillus haynesii]|uniref:YxiJ family protein n=1 Tax=Bacillus haynesii TaxID=1925021 RepID=UPI0022815006|nr:YxiJ family protein [Bacillus haynesii]MCY8370998.1 YxiJ-like family protein [Bacillus haynesii]
MTMKKRYRYYRLDADTVNQLKDMDKCLSGPLPADLDAFEQDGHGLSGDFYEYFALVAGSLGYVLADKKMPKVQHQSLENSIFELYPKDKSKITLRLFIRLPCMKTSGDCCVRL